MQPRVHRLISRLFVGFIYNNIPYFIVVEIAINLAPARKAVREEAGADE